MTKKKVLYLGERLNGRCYYCYYGFRLDTFGPNLQIYLYLDKYRVAILNKTVNTYTLNVEKVLIIYDNEYATIIDIYFYEFFQPFQTSSACAPKHLRHPVWCFGKCLRFSLIKIEPVSVNPSQAVLSLFFFSVVYTFLLK